MAKMRKRLQRDEGLRCPFGVSLCICSVFAHPRALCFYSETCVEAPNEHLAAEVCRVTVDPSRFDCYLQELRTGHFENEQMAAEGRRVTVYICSFPVYLHCFSTFRSTVFLQ